MVESTVKIILAVSIIILAVSTSTLVFTMGYTSTNLGITKSETCKEFAERVTFILCGGSQNCFELKQKIYDQCKANEPDDNIPFVPHSAERECIKGYDCPDDVTERLFRSHCGDDIFCRPNPPDPDPMAPKP